MLVMDLANVAPTTAGGAQRDAVEPFGKQLPPLYTLHFNGHEIICRKDDLAATVEL